MAAAARHVGDSLHLQIRRHRWNRHRSPLDAEIFPAADEKNDLSHPLSGCNSADNLFINSLTFSFAMQSSSEFVRRYIQTPDSTHKPAKPKPGLSPLAPVRPLYPPAASSHRIIHAGAFIKALIDVMHTPQRGETFRNVFGVADAPKRPKATSISNF